MQIVELRMINYEVWKDITRLYRLDPITHAYLMYDLVYELERSNVYFALSDSHIVGYLLLWEGRNLGVHVWGNAEGLVRYIPLDKPMVVQLYNEEFLNLVLDRLRCREDHALVRYYLDMTVDSEGFKPYILENVRKLDVKDVDSYVELKRLQGLSLTREEAIDRLKRWRYYGVFINDKLVSIACAYLKLNEVWVIGEVYTHPEFRGMGYAKAVTSAVTEDAVRCGAKAYLHVNEDNLSAIRAYKALGYNIVNKRPWIFYKAH